MVVQSKQARPGSRSLQFNKASSQNLVKIVCNDDPEINVGYKPTHIKRTFFSISKQKTEEKIIYDVAYNIPCFCNGYTSTPCDLKNYEGATRLQADEMTNLLKMRKYIRKILRKTTVHGREEPSTIGYPFIMDDIMRIFFDRSLLLAGFIFPLLCFGSCCLPFRSTARRGALAS